MRGGAGRANDASEVEVRLVDNEGDRQSNLGGLPRLALSRELGLRFIHAPQQLGSNSARLPLVAIEAARTTPVERAVFSHAKVVSVMHGHAVVQTPASHEEIGAGDLMVTGSGVWISAHPMSMLRTWTIYSDDLAASRLLGLFASVVETLLPALTSPPAKSQADATVLEQAPVLGRITPRPRER